MVLIVRGCQHTALAIQVIPTAFNVLSPRRPTSKSRSAQPVAAQQGPPGPARRIGALSCQDGEGAGPRRISLSALCTGACFSSAGSAGSSAAGNLVDHRIAQHDKVSSRRLQQESLSKGSIPDWSCLKIDLVAGISVQKELAHRTFRTWRGDAEGGSRAFTPCISHSCEFCRGRCAGRERTAKADNGNRFHQGPGATGADPEI